LTDPFAALLARPCRSLQDGAPSVVSNVELELDANELRALRVLSIDYGVPPGRILRFALQKLFIWTNAGAPKHWRDQITANRQDFASPDSQPTPAAAPKQSRKRGRREAGSPNPKA